MNKNGEGLWLALVYRVNKKNAVRCDAQRSTLQQPMQHAARANAPHYMTEVESVLAGSEK